MSGSGPPIGTRHTRREISMIRRDLSPEKFGLCAVVRGATVPHLCAFPSAAQTSRTTGAMLSGFVAPGTDSSLRRILIGRSGNRLRGRSVARGPCLVDHEGIPQELQTLSAARLQ